MKNHRKALAITLALTLAAAACGSSDNSSEAAPAATATTAEAPTTPEETPEATATPVPTATPMPTATPEPVPVSWSTTDVLAVGRLAHDGFTAATVVRTDTGLDLVAFDVESGEEAWRAPYSMAGRFPGSGLGGFAIADEVLAYPSGPLGDAQNSSLVGRDAITGGQLWEVFAPFTLGVETCGPVFCASVADFEIGEIVVQGLDPETGETLWTQSGGDIDYVTDPDLVVALQTGDEPVVTGIDPATGDATWTFDPQAETGENMTSNLGWNFVRTDGVVLGFLGRLPADADNTAGVFAIDEVTGELLWFLPDHRLTRWDNEITLVSAFFDADDWFGHEALEAVDPRTGDLTTIAELPEDPEASTSVVGGGGVAYGGDGTSVFWEADEGWVGVDASTGEAADVPDVLWRSEVDFEDLSELLPGVERNEYLRGRRHQAFDPATGDDITTADADAPPFIGATANGWTIWIDAEGVLHGTEQFG